MEEIVININADNKYDYRRQLISIFLEEECGSTEHSTSYCYYAETLNNGNRIYLKRPTHLNKGIDFEVRVENTQFRTGKHGNIISSGNRPSHSDIYNDLQLKKDESAEKYERLARLIDRTFECQNITTEDLENLTFESHDTEMILKVIKWLFIEQDVTYWNKSGRWMLYNSFREI